ncbi:MAG: FAD-dependent oxidoreductase [Sphingobacteriaceae bacterium]|jgi:hypothetical protein|nr:FAD-dependent oxidoreductase [Sphingobacteriaceae bacterium]
MKKQLFFFLIWIAFFGNLKAQTIKTDVLVVGNGNAAIAAGLQSAISGVKTTVLLQAGGFDINPITGDLNSGLQAAFLKKMKAIDTSQNTVFTKQTANDVLKKWTDSTKNLTIIRDLLWIKAEKAGNNWNFKLSDGKTIKTKILINPADQKLNEALKITAPKSTWTSLDYNSTIYRTSIASGKFTTKTTGNLFSMFDLFIPLQENLVWVSDSQSMLMGQAAGATAAYAAFFKTKTSLANLKTIQGELLNYKLDLMPFDDINQSDTNWKAIQMIGLTGVLKGEIKDNKVIFSPETQVNVDEIKQPIKDYFYKAQIWFDDYKNPMMTLSSTLDMICYVGNKSPENTKKEVEKKWKTSYNFKSDFNLNKMINRREFAVLLQDYMPPFNVNIDNKGKVVR